MLNFPGERDLLSWLRKLEHTDLEPFLPGIDEAWFRQMLSAFQTTALRPDCTSDPCLSGAVIFHKIIKNHYRIDGNKRSAVICTYLFFVANSRHLRIAPDILYELARAVAESHAASEEVVKRIRMRFSEACDLP